MSGYVWQLPQRSECRFTPPPVDPPPFGGPPEARKRYQQRIEAEQARRNAELRAMDHSHIPPLQVADRYADGRRNRRNNQADNAARNDGSRPTSQGEDGVS